jgi:hypothetical protein
MVLLPGIGWFADFANIRIASPSRLEKAGAYRYNQNWRRRGA